MPRGAFAALRIAGTGGELLGGFFGLLGGFLGLALLRLLGVLRLLVHDGCPPFQLGRCGRASHGRDHVAADDFELRFFVSVHQIDVELIDTCVGEDLQLLDDFGR